MLAPLLSFFEASGRLPNDWLRRTAVALAFMAAVLIGLYWAQWGNASPIWPASGIGIAAVFYLGSQVWPAIFLGALVGNLMMSMGLVESSAAACGSVAEALLSLHLYRRLSGEAAPLGNVNSTLHFLAAIAIGTLASALIGTSTLLLLGKIDPALYGQVGITWWLANIVGSMMVGAALLAWWRGAGEGEWRGSGAEFALLMLATLLAGYLVFGAGAPGKTAYPVDFLPLPLMLWAALRFGLRGVSTSMLLIGAWAVWATLGGHGLFARWPGTEGYWLLLSYFLVGGAPMLAVSAITREHEEQRRALLRARDLLGVEAMNIGRERDSARELLRENSARLEMVLSEVPIALWSANAYGRVTLARGLGLGHAERLLAQRGPQPVEALFAGDPGFLEHVRKVLAGTPDQGAIRLGGHLLEAHGKPQYDASGKLTGGLGVAFDASQLTSRHQAALRQADRRDSLTGLASRHEFMAQLAATLLSARQGHHRLILLRLDFGGLETINARYGYDTGDEVLAELAGRLRDRCRAGTMLARLAGDAIAILVGGRYTREQAGQLAEQLIAACAPPYQTVLPDPLVTHVGIALFPDHCNTGEDLLAHAETALERAKDKGPNTFAFHAQAAAGD